MHPPEQLSATAVRSISDTPYNTHTDNTHMVFILKSPLGGCHLPPRVSVTQPIIIRLIQSLLSAGPSRAKGSESVLLRSRRSLCLFSQAAATRRASEESDVWGFGAAGGGYTCIRCSVWLLSRG